MAKKKDRDENTKRIALFRSLKYGHTSSFEMYGNDENYQPCGDSDYVRITKWVNVQFAPLSSAEVAGVELQQLSVLREKTVNEFKEKLDFIDGRIANVRALTGPAS